MRMQAASVGAEQPSSMNAHALLQHQVFLQQQLERTQQLLVHALAAPTNGPAGGWPQQQQQQQQQPQLLPAQIKQQQQQILQIQREHQRAQAPLVRPQPNLIIPSLPPSAPSAAQASSLMPLVAPSAADNPRFAPTHAIPQNLALNSPINLQPKRLDELKVPTLGRLTTQNLKRSEADTGSSEPLANLLASEAKPPLLARTDSASSSNLDSSGYYSGAGGAKSATSSNSRGVCNTPGPSCSSSPSGAAAAGRRRAACSSAAGASSAAVPAGLDNHSTADTTFTKDSRLSEASAATLDGVPARSERPCGHNAWDNVRAAKGKITLRCRKCQLQWRAPAELARHEARCEAFADGKCDLGDHCEKMHLHYRKQCLEERLSQHGKSVLKRVKPQNLVLDPHTVMTLLTQIDEFSTQEENQPEEDMANLRVAPCGNFNDASPSAAQDATAHWLNPRGEN
ncbi:hypothetical protein DIPPA_20476 [Diplonema papillatum]|nr:hypothetical protein DIPPA_20476 [Diplonema papillatum]